jgi:hypothetical protein
MLKILMTSPPGEQLVVKHGFLHAQPHAPSGAKRRNKSCPPELPDVKPEEPKFRKISFSTTDSNDLECHVTTVMVRNIPTRFTSVSLLSVLDEAGFMGTYSFFYLPMDFRTGKNMGYCFINFLTPDLARLFANIFHGTRLGVTTSHKVLQVTASKRQGLKENVALFKGSDLLNSCSLPFFKPFVLVGGELLPLCAFLFDLIVYERYSPVHNLQ